MDRGTRAVFRPWAWRVRESGWACTTRLDDDNQRLVPPRPKRRTDKRIRLTEQMVEGARTIKMGGWEPLIEQRIKAARELEMIMLQRAGAFTVVGWRKPSSMPRPHTLS